MSYLQYKAIRLNEVEEISIKMKKNSNYKFFPSQMCML